MGLGLQLAAVLLLFLQLLLQLLQVGGGVCAAPVVVSVGESAADTFITSVASNPIVGSFASAVVHNDRPASGTAFALIRFAPWASFAPPVVAAGASGSSSSSSSSGVQVSAAVLRLRRTGLALSPAMWVAVHATHDAAALPAAAWSESSVWADAIAAVTPLRPVLGAFRVSTEIDVEVTLNATLVQEFFHEGRPFDIVLNDVQPGEAHQFEFVTREGSPGQGPRLELNWTEVVSTTGGAATTVTAAATAAATTGSVTAPTATGSPTPSPPSSSPLPPSPSTAPVPPPSSASSSAADDAGAGPSGSAAALLPVILGTVFGALLLCCLLAAAVLAVMRRRYGGSGVSTLDDFNSWALPMVPRGGHGSDVEDYGVEPGYDDEHANVYDRIVLEPPVGSIAEYRTATDVADQENYARLADRPVLQGKAYLSIPREIRPGAGAGAGPGAGAGAGGAGGGATRSNRGTLRGTLHERLDVLEASSVLLDMSRNIGKGAFGVVLRGRVAGTDVAVKMLKPGFTEEQLSSMYDECDALASLPTHPNVVGIIGVCPDPFMIVLELAAQGSVMSFLRRNGASTDAEGRAQMALHAARGMAHLASHDVVHRDLATRNLLLTADMTVKIADFGLSRFMVDEQHHSKSDTGPARWMAPEGLKKGHFSEKSDVWSYGVVLWELYTDAKRLPYDDAAGDSTLEILRGVLEGTTRLRMPEGTPQRVVDLADATLTVDPEQRPTFAQCVTALEG